MRKADVPDDCKILHTKTGQPYVRRKKYVDALLNDCFIFIVFNLIELLKSVLEPP